jgi:predicted ArsR family transcriptional regulator
VTRFHRALSDASRVRILEQLAAASGPLDARELAERVGLHPNTVRAHLEVLGQAELVSARAEERRRPGRPRIVYEAAERDLPAQELGGYQLLAEILAGCLQSCAPEPAVQAEQAGFAWGRFLIRRPRPLTAVSSGETLAEVVRLQEELGFRPKIEAGEGGGELRLHRCPFSEAAKAHQGVVCSVHLGLVRGALAELGGNVQLARLEPFAEPGLCVGHLSAVR